MLGDARVQGTRALDLKEHVKRCAGKTLAPTRRVNPIGNLARILDREARDLSDQDAVVLDRAQRVLRIRSNTAVVGVERLTVRSVRARLSLRTLAELKEKCGRQPDPARWLRLGEGGSRRGPVGSSSYRFT